MEDDASLPEGWTKHWSNSWKKNYWFNSKTGKQSWEHPGAGSSSGGDAKHEHPAPSGQTASAGEKRKAPETVPAQQPSSKMPKEEGSGSATAGGTATSPVKKPAPAAAGGGLASILGSIASSTRAPTAKELEIRKKKKEAEEARMSEVKAERENYKQWVGFQLNSYIEEEREYYEFPPSDSMHRIIAKDEAEERGLVAFSHGEKEEEKRVYVFRDGKGPNQLESRYLQLGGTVQELVERRARGDTFKEYNTAFSLNDAKLVTRTKPQQAGPEDNEDEIQSRKVNDRNFDSNKAKEIANKIRESRSESAKEFLQD